MIIQVRIHSLSLSTRDDDEEDENHAKPTASKKRKSEVVENNSKTLLSYFAPKPAEKSRRISGSHFFRAAHLQSAQLSL